MLSLALALLACSADDPVLAGYVGEPEDAADIDPASDDYWSRLADAGFEAVPGQYNVVFDRDVAEMGGVLRDLEIGLPDAEIVRDFERLPIATLRLSYDDAVALAGRADVLAVEPDWIAFMHPGKGGSKSSCATSSSQTTPTGVSAMGTNTDSGAGVAVAVLDTGIDLTHTDLSVAGGSDQTGKGTYADDNGHGTHVGGTIAALDNSAGVVGVAPDVSLYAVKVLDRRGSGSYSVIAAGIDWSVANGMDVVNMSLGGTYSSSTLKTAVDNAHAANVIQVVAAGNSGVNASTEYPAAYDGKVLTISAYDWSTSSWPYWTNYGSVVDVAAQGVSVCSTTKGGSWGNMDGTSMATPHVAGAVAVHLSGGGSASFSAVESAIEGSVSTLADTSKHTEDFSLITKL